MLLKKVPVIFTTAMTLSTTSLAQFDSGIDNNNANATYDYLGIQYITQEWNSCDQDGLSVNGSITLSGGIYAKGAYTDVDGDNCGSSTFEVGAGYHEPLTDNFDWYALLSYMNTDYGPGDDSGIAAEGGMQGYLSEHLESRLSFRHTSVGDGETTIGGGFSFWFSERLAATADASVGGDTTTLQAGAQYTF